MEQEKYPEVDNLKESQYYYLGVLSAKSNAFYNFLMLLVILIIGSLPFIKVKVTQSAPASIHSKKYKEDIFSPTAGRITKLNIKTNRVVKEGDTILSIDNKVAIGELGITLQKEMVLEKSLQDISTILSFSSDSINTHLTLSQPKYIDQYLDFLSQKKQLTVKYQNVSKTYSRNKILFDKKIISASEYEEFSFLYNQAKIEIELLEKKFKSQLQVDRYQMAQELANLNINKNQTKELIKTNVITANTSGTGYIAAGVQLGTYLQVGQKIAEIIPDSGLIAACIVSPKDIAFIKIGQRVKMQIDSYNFYDWGMVDGSVSEIFKDVDMIDNKPYYSVYCQIEKPFLKLKNGSKGLIIKGMTGRANFVLTERTLWQLLFTKVIDWFHPQGN